MRLTESPNKNPTGHLLQAGVPLPAIDCGPVGEASTAFAYVTVQSDESDGSSSTGYVVTVIFNWGPSSETRVVTDLAYGVRHTFNATYIYTGPGLYVTRSVLTIGQGGGSCEGARFEHTQQVLIEEDSCDWGVSPSSPPLSPEPTPAPTPPPSSGGWSTFKVFVRAGVLVSLAVLYLW